MFLRERKYWLPRRPTEQGTEHKRTRSTTKRRRRAQGPQDEGDRPASHPLRDSLMQAKAGYLPVASPQPGGKDKNASEMRKMRCKHSTTDNSE